MPVELKMPALSPTMEEGTLAKWLVKEGDTVTSGDLLAEIETDKATMEFESIDEGTVTQILIPAGTENVKVGAVIAIITGEGEDANAAPAAKTAPPAAASGAAPAPAPAPTPARPEPVEAPTPSVAPSSDGTRLKASPLAKRIAAATNVNLATITGTGPGGRIVKADVEGAQPDTTPAPKSASAEPVEAPGLAAAAPQATPAKPFITDIPHTAEKLSNMRRTIARRLTQSMQEAPHIYLTVDIRLDALLKLRGELNKALEPQGIKLSVNDLLIKALAKALIMVPKCNVSFTGDQLVSYARADISVAVSIPTGLITPIIVDAGSKSISAISTEMAALADKAKAGKLQPHEYQGGTASISNMGMMGIKQFTAVINPPQGMIMAIGAGEKRAIVTDDALAIATVMTATGSFDHRAIDGADGAQLMGAFKALVENPLGLVA
jgi:pyruvate dehydrogenase E2 component (dihydrolipoamide acetyltransferase)